MFCPSFIFIFYGSKARKMQGFALLNYIKRYKAYCLRLFVFHFNLYFMKLLFILSFIILLSTSCGSDRVPSTPSNEDSTYLNQDSIILFETDSLPQ
jgi:hypothetical protein